MREHTSSTNWPWLVAGGMFDMKNSISVLLGYSRMLDVERLGPLTEGQRHVVRELTAATRQIAEIASALSGLASLHGAGWRIEPGAVSVRELLTEFAGLPALRNLGPVDVQIDNEQDKVVGVLSLHRQALTSLTRSIGLDQLNSERPLSVRAISRPADSECWVVITATDQIHDAEKISAERLLPFDDCPSRFSMDLPFANGIVRACGGQILALPNGMAGAVVILPTATK